MKFCQRETHIKPKNLINCYRIIGGRVYFQDGLTAYFYDFKNMSELRKLQMERVRANMNSGNVDDWECCNPEGFWSGEIHSKLTFQRKSKEEREVIEKIEKLLSLEPEELSEFEKRWIEENLIYENAI